MKGDPRGSRFFVDRRLHAIVNSIVPFSAVSVSDAIGETWSTKSVVGRDEEIYGLTFLMMLNVVTSQFENSDSYFSRGLVEMDAEGICVLLADLYRTLPEEEYLRDAGLTSSLGVEQADRELDTELTRLHEKGLSMAEYEHMQSIQDSLVDGFLRPYLPNYVAEEYRGLAQFIDDALKSRLGVSRGDLEALRLTLIEMEKRVGKSWITPEEDVLSKYASLTLTPRGLFNSSLEHLYVFPPFLIQQEGGRFLFRVHEQPFIWIRKKELEFLNGVKRKHSNIAGDSLEALLREYLLNRRLVMDMLPPISLTEEVKTYPHHYEYARANLHLSRNGREDIFSVLRNPRQPEIEIDLVANHPEGFSIVAESKYVASYEKAKEAYFDGSHRKEPERDRLLGLSKFLNDHPDRKVEIGVPEKNPLYPVFITNAVGPLFAETDGVIKATPLEVMKLDPFYGLLKKAREQSVRNS